MDACILHGLKTGPDWPIESVQPGIEHQSSPVKTPKSSQNRESGGKTVLNDLCLVPKCILLVYLGVNDLKKKFHYLTHTHTHTQNK